MCFLLALTSRSYGVQNRIEVGSCPPSFYHVSTCHVARETQQAELVYKHSNSTQTAVKIATQTPFESGGGNIGRVILQHFSRRQNASTLSEDRQLPVWAGCNQAQLTSTLPLALGASLSKAFKLVSRSSTSQPVQRSTTLRSTLRCALASSLYLVARSIFPHRGFSLLFPPASVEDPAASKRTWERATTKSSSVLVTPQAPSPGW